MKNMYDVYERIKKEYKNIDIKLEHEECIRIYVDEYEIESCEDFTVLAKNNREITHIHHEQYDDVYSSIKNYIDDRNKIEKEIKINELKIYLLAIIVNVILLAILAVFS